jgi:hypothetical protein
VSHLWARLRDPSLTTVLVLALAALGAVALLVLGYRGVALRLLVPYQVPFLVSASVLGATLLGAACMLLAAHLDRVEAAAERDALTELQREALQLLSLAAPPARD